MAATGKVFNQQTRIYAKLHPADAALSDTIVGLLDANTTEATKAADDWDAIETFVQDANDNTKTTSAQIGDDTLEFSSFIGDANQETVYPYSGERQGVSRPLPSAGQSWTFNLDEYDRSNEFHKSLEDATGKQQRFDLIAVTASDDKEAKSTGGTEKATARCATAILNVARVPFGTGDERMGLEIVAEVQKTRIVDQA